MFDHGCLIVGARRPVVTLLASLRSRCRRRPSTPRYAHGPVAASKNEFDFAKLAGGRGLSGGEVSLKTEDGLKKLFSEAEKVASVESETPTNTFSDPMTSEEARTFEPPSVAPTSVAPKAVSVKSTLVLRLCRVAATTDRGAASSPAATASILEIIAQLEMLGMVRSTAREEELLDGRWALLWSSGKALERATSPVFWSVEAFTDALVEKGTGGLIFELTDSLKGAVGLKYGSLTQTFSKAAQTLTSEVELTIFAAMGLVPLSGTVTTVARVTPLQSGLLRVSPVSTKVVGSPFQGLDSVAVPVDNVFETLLNAHQSIRGEVNGNPSDVLLRTTYLDEEVRICRLGSEVVVYMRD
ncbi:hypothetical protein CYMTET_23091 [Cymbomonas tetramitiformis]|uniref:Plastid lipid-associated protein/fibrillin conserved domain-containing protein n=1 Tax=Cymbomonas tetramitiformis TaxID=36881 RepID=A0AAE0FZ52_9CHLO|nr:hypothetical protein CYMTET_23091 [Cymbomonas tetramitiformis]